MLSQTKLIGNEVSIEDRMQRGIDPLPLEPEALINRVNAGDWSGEFLGKAFLSMYFRQPFDEPLFNLINLDAEGFRLFHSAIHARHVPGWRDDILYDLACEIKDLLS